MMLLLLILVTIILVLFFLQHHCIGKYICIVTLWALFKEIGIKTLKHIYYNILASMTL